MKLRYLLWAAAVLAVIGFAVVMIPGSPLSLQNTVGDPVSEDLPDDMPLSELTNPNRVKKERPLREWTADLASPDKKVRLSALNAINRIAPLAANAAVPVAKLVQADPDPQVREKASQVLYRMGAGAKPALDVATAALADDSPVVRRNAALFMMVLKTDARPAVPALIKAMNDPRNEETLGHNETIQQVAAAALGGVSAGTAEAVPALTEVVTSGRPLPVRATAARALGMIGQPARPAVPALTALLASVDQKDLDTREDITVALRALGENPPDVVRPKTQYPAGYVGGSAGVVAPKGGAAPKQEGDKTDGDKTDGGSPNEGKAPPAEKAPAPQRKKGG